MSYELDPLPYDYDALEPHLSEQVLEWHHDTHHQGYVNGWNSAEETLEANREEHDFVVGGGDPERDPQLVGSHPARPVLAEHEPGGRRRARWRAGRPDRGGLRLVRRLEGRVRGGGVRRVRLGALSVRHILEPAAERRGRQARPGRDLGRSPDSGAGRGEHSYYHDYGPARGEFVDNFFEVVDWNEPATRYEQAVELFE